MHHFYKLAWFLRALILAPFFGKFSLPSYIGPPVFLHRTRGMFIGTRVRIFPGLRAECHGSGKLFIHNNVAIGQGFHVTCMGELHIGEGTLITGNVTVTDIDHDYELVGTPVFDQPMTWKKTSIGKSCFIGMGARIQAGTELGRGCVVGSNSVVRGNFPPHSVIVGAPGRVIKRYNETTGNWERC